MEMSFSENGRSLDTEQGLYSVLAAGVRNNPDLPVLSRKIGDKWHAVSFREFTDQVEAVAQTLLRQGVRHGDRVALLGRNCYEWVLADYAALAIGAVPVPVYPTASEYQIRHVLADSGAGWFFAETAEDAERLQAAGAGTVRLFSELDNWLNTPVGAEFTAHRGQVRAGDLATIVYTSGTTGPPKGCMLTHSNMYASSANTVLHTGWLFHRAAENDETQAASLMALPLSHVFGRSFLLSCLIAGTRTGLVADIGELLAELPVFRPTLLGLVPYALEKIRKRAPGNYSVRTRRRSRSRPAPSRLAARSWMPQPGRRIGSSTARCTSRSVGRLAGGCGMSSAAARRWTAPRRRSTAGSVCRC
jgi:long-chain acyl-CoA synthetase